MAQAIAPKKSERISADQDRPREIKAANREELSDPHHYNMPRFLPEFRSKVLAGNDLRCED